MSRARWARGLAPRSASFALLALLALPALPSCGGPTRPSDCSDGRDNDADGLIDSADPGCALSGGVVEVEPSECADEDDNDGDGLIDLADPGCDDVFDDSETDPLRACNDGVDNDADTLTDFPQDPGCDGPLDENEFNAAACGDGLDNDGDGNIDYPNDPGCESIDDVSEVTPVPPPGCFDNLDNDGDALIDYPDDPGCSAASDDNEYNPQVGECGPSLLIDDLTIVGQASGTYDGPRLNELVSDVCGGFGGEFAYTFTVKQPATLTVSTDYPETTLDTVVYVREVCLSPATELGCDDDGGTITDRASHLVLSVEPGIYFVVVDGFSPGSLGSFRLTVTATAP